MEIVSSRFKYATIQPETNTIEKELRFVEGLLSFMVNKVYQC